MKRVLSILVILAGLGSIGAQFPVGFWTQAAAGGGTPAFGSELQVGNVRSTTADYTITLAGNVAVGKRLVVLVGNFYYTLTIASVTDSKGNSYTVHFSGVGQSNVAQITGMASANIASGKNLTTSDTLTVTLSATDTISSHIAIYVLLLDNCAAAGQPDQSASGGAITGTPISIAASTTATNTCIVGITDGAGGAATTSATGWTATSADFLPTDEYNYHYRCYYKNVTASGSQNPSVTTAASYWEGCWVAFK